MNNHFRVEGATHPGTGKRTNEDWCGVISSTAGEYLIVVADGVGSERQADRGARIAVQTVVESYRDKRQRATEPIAALYHAVRDADRALGIVSASFADQWKSGLYTTLSAVAYSAPNLHICYLGDSPILLFDGSGQIVWRSIPHTDPIDGVVLRYLGSGNLPEPTQEELEFPSGGLLVVGSDGLQKGDDRRETSGLSVTEIWRICRDAPALDQAACRLVEECVRRQADDVTVMLACAWPEAPREVSVPPRASEQSGQRVGQRLRAPETALPGDGGRGRR